MRKAEWLWRLNLKRIQGILSAEEHAPDHDRAQGQLHRRARSGRPYHPMCKANDGTAMEKSFFCTVEALSGTYMYCWYSEHITD
jgi:hypothetical protein